MGFVTHWDVELDSIFGKILVCTNTSRFHEALYLVPDLVPNLVPNRVPNLVTNFLFKITFSKNFLFKIMHKEHMTMENIIRILLDIN